MKTSDLNAADKKNIDSGTYHTYTERQTKHMEAINNKARDHIQWEAAFEAAEDFIVTAIDVSSRLPKNHRTKLLLDDTTLKKENWEECVDTINAVAEIMKKQIEEYFPFQSFYSIGMSFRLEQARKKACNLLIDKAAAIEVKTRSADPRRQAWQSGSPSGLKIQMALQRAKERAAEQAEGFVLEKKDIFNPYLEK